MRDLFARFAQTQGTGPLIAALLFLLSAMPRIAYSQTWTASPPPGYETMTGVSFVNADTGCIIGYYTVPLGGGSGPLVFTTTDGGSSWTDDYSNFIGINNSNNLSGVDFMNPNNCIVIGDFNGASPGIIKTTDVGATWSVDTVGLQYQGDYDVLNGISFSDANNGTVVGFRHPAFPDLALLYRTTNGGASWSWDTTGVETGYGGLNGVSSINANNVTVVGDNGAIFRTTNGGGTWVGQTSGTTHSLRGVSFTDSSNGTAVGVSGTILRTTNAGATWTQQTSGTTVNLNAICFTDANTGTVVGDNGTILRTTNGGTTWTQETSGTKAILKALSFVNANDGFIAGDRLTVLKTTNGSDISLNVEATNFSATSAVNSVTLSWSTQSEVNNAGFNVLRRDPGAASFRLIANYLNNGALRGIGTSSTGRGYSFTDSRVKSGSSYQYKIQSVSTTGETKDLTTLQVTVDLPKDYALYQNYPNPFNPSTTIRFDLKEQSTVTLDIYNVLGQRVLEYSYGAINAGRYNEVVNMDRFASGIYFYRVSAVGSDGQKFVAIKRLVLMK